ncbi:ATP-binding protein [Pontibacter anaerobius]|uniref:histidine kinase n=1 Tax=Pontibacter anaerobius TaxID=2993940 RepID=A0ABT3RC29_9BACT|nr:ATP-binding protein [Pontibacter anaerobius]MCX2739077.1 GAF domain-containing protein [Pontibacter anaerobius]
MQNYQNYNVDLSNCDKEPIHIIGRIQPHGFMLILNKGTLEVEQVSENIGEFLQTDAAILAGQTLEVLATPAEYEKLKQKLTLDEKEVSLVILELQGEQFFGFLHTSQGSLVLECEPYVEPQGGQEFLELTGAYTTFQAELDRQESLVAQAELTVRFVQQAIDYDQVMLYRFDEDWNGEVIAEKVSPGQHSYLHHHFPATDIPAQARELLLKKTVRQIANVSAAAVNIIPYINPETGSPSNIIRSELRNPSEIHLEYLQNMGVQATLSVSIIVNGKLWGIVACQHKAAKFLNYWKRQLCQHIAQAFANVVLAHQEKRDLQQLEEYRVKEGLLLRELAQSPNLHEGLLEQSHTFLELSEATGVALTLGGKVYTAGIIPDKAELEKLIEWVSENVSDGIFHTRELSKVYAPADAFRERASGLLVVELSKFNKEYLLYFKPELSETKVWAGQPEKMNQEKSGRIQPRKSFAKWEQVVKGKSVPWTLNELDTAQILVKDLVALVLKNQQDNLQSLNNRLSHSSEILQAKNRRLEDFTQIIAHNLRSPLSNMLGLSHFYNAHPEEETSNKVMDMMGNMIVNMSNTLDDLNLILESDLGQKLTYQEVYLPDVVEKELQNLQAVILETGAQVETDLQVKTLIAPKVYLESIMHNLVSNALKYRSPERKPIILIKSWQEQHLVCFAVTDNGVGINLQKVGHKMFRLYSTFHKNKDAKGLGLYLTKVQVEALGGHIQVKSTLGEGTTFTVCLKV